MSLLLQNAIESIRLGVEPFESTDRARLLSAVRNLHAGVLLLYKEALRRLSPEGSDEVLLREKIVPELRDGVVVFRGKGKKTANIQQIKERFEGLGIRTDWRLFDRITDVRNDIEHYFSDANDSLVREVISDAFVLVRDFLEDELYLAPMDTLGQPTWSTMLSVSEVMEREREVCEKALAAVAWESDTLSAAVRDLSCAACGSSLLIPNTTPGDPELVCRQCGHTEACEAYAERALREHLSYDIFLAARELESPICIACPFCLRETYIVEERRCAVCGQECVHRCEFCECTIPAEELSEGVYCGRCQHMLAKGD